MSSRRKTKSASFTNCCNSADCGLNCQSALFCSDINFSLNSMDKTDYASKNYWDQRYADGSIEHEWYYSFDILEPIIFECREFQPNDKVLEVGCGDKPLINGFLKLGVDANNLVGVDYAKSVIDALKLQQSSEKFPRGIILKDMDGSNMEFDDESFDFVCEKGTMDAILSDKQPARGVRNSIKLVSEMIRVMKVNATLLIVSHIEVDSDEFDILMNEILMPSLALKSNAHWKIEAHVVNQESNSDDEDEQPRKRKKKNREETEPKGYGTVYVIRSIPRKLTRHSADTGEVSFEVKSYDE